MDNQLVIYIYGIYLMMQCGFCIKEEWGCFDLRVKCNNPQCQYSAYNISNVPSCISIALSCSENEAVFVTNFTYYLPSTWDNYCINQTSCAKTTYDDDCVCCNMPGMARELCTNITDYFDYPCGYFTESSCLFNVSRIQVTNCGSLHIFGDEDKYGNCLTEAGGGYCFSRWTKVEYECHTITTGMDFSYVKS